MPRAAVACIDSSWTYPGNGDYDGLLVETDVTAEAVGRKDEVRGWISEARAIVAQMKDDEARHADAALHAGGVALPAPVRGLMRLAAKVMTVTAHRI